MPRVDLSRALGGAIGRHGARGGVWFSPTPWVMLGATFSWLVVMARQVPCLNDWSKAYTSMCYSDITPLYYGRGLAVGQIPYLDSKVEYPVLTGGLMELGRRLVMLFGGVSSPSATPAQQSQAVLLFFGITAVLLFLLFLVVVWAHLRMARPCDAVMIALSPLVMAEGLINWDALVLACTALAFLAWSRKRPGWAGIWIGLGIAAKLYPLLLLVPLAVLCVRASKWRSLGWVLGGTAGAWIAVNLPVYLATPSGWLNFWTYNVGRGADLGSFWYALRLSQIDVGDPSALVTVLMLIGAAVVAALMGLAPRRPRFAQGAFLLVTWFLVINKVYSPQYGLWLLPLVVLATPRWTDWVAFTLGDLLYFAAIWGHLAGTLSNGAGAERVYVAAVLLRIAIHLFLCGRVIHDIWQPAGDPVRLGGLDDPDGGVLDKAPDAPWVARLLDIAS